jgi:hypothetical protein
LFSKPILTKSKIITVFNRKPLYFFSILKTSFRKSYENKKNIFILSMIYLCDMHSSVLKI